jgi:hypothetical protein
MLNLMYLIEEVSEEADIILFDQCVHAEVFKSIRPSKLINDRIVNAVHDQVKVELYENVIHENRV